MRCSCGKEGSIILKRRDLPYCERCFALLLRKLARHEIGDGPLALYSTKGQYGKAAVALCALAGRDWVLSSTGFVAGNQATQAEAVLRYMLGREPNLEQHFPASITAEELQRFMSVPEPEPSGLRRELEDIEQQYPGTISSIAKYALDKRERGSQ